MKQHPIYTNYLIHTDGTVSHKDTGAILKPFLDAVGTKRVTLNYNDKRVQRRVAFLVLQTYDEVVPSDYKIRFSDGNKSNCNLSNLSYTTTTTKNEVIHLIRQHKNITNELLLSITDILKENE